MEPKGIFRIIPTTIFIEEIIKSLGFFGLNDRKIFTKNDISNEKFERILFLIEPYYLPCKAKRFLYNINELKQITILRHLLRSQGYDLLVQEKVLYSQKVTTYQIFQKIIQNDLSNNFLIEF